jgi:hypothetical protein
MSSARAAGIVAGEPQPVVETGVVLRLGCSGLDCRSWLKFSPLGRRWIPPHGRPSSIKETGNPPKWQNWNSNPLQILLSPIPHPRFRVLCQFSCSLSAHNHHIPKAFSALSSTQCQTLVFAWNSFQDKAQPLRDSRHLPLPK